MDRVNPLRRPTRQAPRAHRQLVSRQELDLREGAAISANKKGGNGELPLCADLRVVGEVNGKRTKAARPNNSALFGCIWQPSESNLFLDTGVRRGISCGPPDGQLTAVSPSAAHCCPWDTPDDADEDVRLSPSIARQEA